MFHEQSQEDCALFGTHKNEVFLTEEPLYVDIGKLSPLAKLIK
jgi:hypothetical protein